MRSLQLQRLHERLHFVVVAGSDEIKDSGARAEDETQFEAGATLEVIALQAANAEAGMQVRCTKAVTHRVNHACDLAAAGLREGADSCSKPLRKINQQCLLPGRQCNA